MHQLVRLKETFGHDYGAGRPSSGCLREDLAPADYEGEAWKRMDMVRTMLQAVEKETV